MVGRSSADAGAVGPGGKSAQRDSVPAYPHLVEFGILLAVWVTFFHLMGNSTLGYIKSPSLFVWWNYVMSGTTDQDYAYLLPFVVLGLFYWRRQEFAAIPKRLWWPAIFIVVVALLGHLLGALVQQSSLSVIFFVLGIYGITGLFWGWRWLRAAFLPFALLAFCVPLGSGGEALTVWLRLLATQITAFICHVILAVDVIQRGNLLFDAAGHFQYEVAAACSGIRSLTSLLAFAIIYSFLNFKSLWRIGLMVLSAIPLAVAANVMRLVMIVIAAEAFGQSAGDWVHENGIVSLLPYVPSVGAMVLLGRWLRNKNTSDNVSNDPEPALVGKAQEA
jgi:exosortase